MVVPTPKYLYTAPRVYTRPQDLPEIDANETFPSDARLVVYPATGLPQMLSQQQTAAFRDFLLGSTTPVITITALAFASAGSAAANSPVNTVLGTLSYTATGGALVNPVLSLVTNAGGKLKVAGNQVQLALGNVAQGSYAFRARIAADNATAFEADLSVTIAAVATPPTITGITLTLAGSVTANSAAETLVGTLAAQTTGGALVNPVFTLVNTAGGDFKVNAGTNGVRFAVNNVPAGTFTIRAQVTSDNVAAYQQDLTVTVTAAIVGAGEGLDFDFGYGRAGTLAVPFSYKAATAMPAGEVVQFAQPSAAKDLPAGWRWYAVDAGGNRVDVQQDMEGTFGADGSLETAALTITNGTARTAGTVVPLTLKAEQVAPNRTPVITPTQVRAELANLKMEATGYDLGSDTLVMPAAWVLDNCKEWTAASPGWIATPGVAPVGGWQYLKRGPQCVDLLIWGYYRNTDLTASHKWLRVDLLCQRLANGMWDIGVVQSQSNTFNAHPLGTLGLAKQARIACTARLLDGATALHVWGGAGDPNAVVRPLTAVDRATGRIDFAGGFADDHGGDGAVIGITGSDLPAGVVSGQTLGHVKYDGSGSVLALERNRLDAGKVAFGSGGSGNATFTPLCTTWPNGMAALYTPQGERVRWGASNRPLVLPMHDRLYLTQRAKVVPAMNPALPNIKLPNQFKPKHILGTAVSFSYALQATSNNEDDDRLGFATSTQMSLLWAPDDEARHRRAVVNSLGFMTFQIAHVDEEAGVPVVYNRGPLALSDGSTRYAGMGANTPEWTAYAGYNGIGIGAFNTPNPAPRTPGHFFQAKWKQEIGVPGWSAYENQYDVLLEGSHAPNHHLVPWLRSADFVHLMALRACAVVAMSSYSVMSAVDGVTNLALNSGGRTMAWPLALAITSEGALPDGAPGKAFLFDLVEHTGKHMSGPRLATHLGRFIGQVGGKGASYMMAYLHMVEAQILLQGKHPGWRPAVENGAIWSVAQYDDQQGPIPNGAYSFGLYGNDADNTRDSGDGYGSYPHYYPSLMAFKEAKQADYGYLPFPSTGVADGFPALTYTSRAEMCVLRQFKTAYHMGVLGGGAASAGRVETQVLARLGAAGKTLTPGSNGTTTLFPQWDMVSFLPPAATVLPNAVTGMAVSNIFARTATVSWAVPSIGGPVFTHRIEVKKGSAAYVTVHEDWNNPSIDLTALADGATNIVRITAKNPVGTSTASATVSFTTPVEVTGTISGPASEVTVNTAGVFAVSASAYPVWACLRSGVSDIGSRVQVASAGNVSLTPTTTAPHTARLYTAQTGGVLVDDTPPFTPVPSQVSLYNFTWFGTDTPGQANSHNVATPQAYKFNCQVAKKSDNSPASPYPQFVFCLAGADPGGGPFDGADLYNDGQGFHVFFAEGKQLYAAPGTYDLWVMTADGERNKDPSGVYVRT